jgi:hypothetical protein
MKGTDHVVIIGVPTDSLDVEQPALIASGAQAESEST